MARVARVIALTFALFVALPNGAEAVWKHCADEGGTCSCFGKTRYGHHGELEHFEDDGAWFKAHPEVVRFIEADSRGDYKCGSEYYEGFDPFPGQSGKYCQCQVPEAKYWRKCANAGETCKCNEKDHNDLVRIIDSQGKYSGITDVDGNFKCPSDPPDTQCDCLENPPEPEFKWEWCGGEGDFCPCDTTVRYGATGTNDMYLDGYFAKNPEVRKWDVKNVSTTEGLSMVLCDKRSFEGTDPFPGQRKICQCMMEQKREEELLYWKWCAGEGGQCPCNTGSRFGFTGEPELYDEHWFAKHTNVVKWNFRAPEYPAGNFTCDKESFPGGIDPFPGREKMCQCLIPVPPKPSPTAAVDEVLEKKHKDWNWCTKAGGTCHCNGLVRFGSTGNPDYYKNESQWFHEHPEVRRCRLTSG